MFLGMDIVQVPLVVGSMYRLFLVYRLFVLVILFVAMALFGLFVAIPSMGFESCFTISRWFLALEESYA